MPARTSFRSAIAGLSLGLTILAMPGAAMAQVWVHGPLLSPREVVEELRADGFRRISPPLRNRDAYVLDAIDPYDAPVRVIVSALDGRILAVHPQRGAGRYVAPRGMAPVDDLDDDEVIYSSPPVQRAPRQAAAPPRPVDPPRTTNPALTPKNPTSVKTSPLAIPKDKDDKADKGKDGAAAAPGSKASPRVIPLAPNAAPAAPPASSSAPVAPALTPTPPMVPTAPLE